MKEELIKLGLTEEQAKEVIKLHKAEIDGKYEPKTRNEELRDLNKALKEQNKTLSDEVSGLKKLDKDNESLKTKIDQINAENTEKIKTMQADFDKKSKYSATKAEYGSQVHDFDVFWQKLNPESVKLDDKGAVTGVKEQADQIRKDAGYLFKSADSSKQQTDGSQVKFKGIQPGTANTEQSGGGDTKDLDFATSLAKHRVGSPVQNDAASYYFGEKKPQ
jgi:hypothetical protein